MSSPALVGQLRLAISWLAVAFAASSWLVAAALFAEPLVSVPSTTEARTAGRSSDPCALREPQATGTDTRCAFALAVRDRPAFTVDLEQRWEGNVLAQWLNVRAGGPDAAHFVFARSAGPRPMRIQQLFTVSRASDEHLVYVLGLCGGLSCGASEIWIVAAPDGHIVPHLKLTLGQGAQAALADDGAVVVSETADRLGLGTRLIRTLRWEDGRYRIEQSMRESLGPR